MTTYKSIVTYDASAMEPHIDPTDFADVRYAMQLKLLEGVTQGQTDGFQQSNFATINGGNVRIISRNWNDPNAAQDWINFNANLGTGFISGTVTTVS